MLAAATVLLLTTSGCSQFSYYLQAVNGQTQLLWSRTPITELLDAPATDPTLAGKLALVMSVREYASDKMFLPVGGAYSSYVELSGTHVVWNLQASAALSLESREWCFPVAGCVAYKGFFDESAARRAASEQTQAGDDVYIRGVDAYSTLGWFDDPVLSSFASYPDEHLTALLFHELAHRKLYIKGDTAFNESWATAIQIAASHRWLNASGSPDGRLLAIQRLADRSSVNDLVQKTLATLDSVYGDAALDDSQKLVEKRQILKALPGEYARLEENAGHTLGYTDFFSQPLNNAVLLSFGYYNVWVAALLNKLDSLDGDLQSFYRWSEGLAELDQTERDRVLKALS